MPVSVEEIETMYPGRPVVAVPVQSGGMVPEPPDQGFLEAMRFLRAGVQSDYGAPEARTILVHTIGRVAQPRVLAGYLAASFAEAGKRVCLVSGCGDAIPGMAPVAVHVIDRHCVDPLSFLQKAARAFEYVVTIDECGTTPTEAHDASVLFVDTVSVQRKDLGVLDERMPAVGGVAALQHHRRSGAQARSGWTALPGILARYLRRPGSI